MAQWVEQMASDRRFPARAVSRCPWAGQLAPIPPQGNGVLHSKRVDASPSSRWRLGWETVG